MPVIRIDDEVMSRLQARAVKDGLVFSTPNAVIRILLDETSNNSKETHLTLSSPSQTEEANVSLPKRDQSSAHRLNGRTLLQQHKDLSQRLRAHAHIDGTFYKWPDSFPAILFDNSGYVIFRSEESMINSHPKVTSHPESRKVNVRKSISSLPTYVKCAHSHRPV